MAEKHDHTDDDHDLDENALAALVRPSAAPPPDKSAGAANGGDDDAVLDLRALATSQAPPPLEPEPEVRRPEPVPEPAAQMGAKKPEATAKAEPAAPRTVETRPAAAQPARGSGGMVTGLVIGLAVAGAAAFFLTREQDEPEPPAGELAAAEPRSVSAAAEGSPSAPFGEETEASGPAEGAEAASGQSEAAGETQEGAETGAGTDVTAEAGAEAAAEVGAAEPESRQSRAARRRAARRAGGSMQAAAAAEPAAGAAEQASAREAGSQPAAAQPAESGHQLDSVLDNALGGRPAQGGTRTVASERPAASGSASASASAALPDTPPRSDVSRTLGRMLPQIRQCAADQVGLANATIIVRNDGTVGSVSIGGHPFGGTPQGACMEGVIRRAQFQPFRQSTFRITYPFAIRPTP